MENTLPRLSGTATGTAQRGALAAAAATAPPCPAGDGDRCHTPNQKLSMPPVHTYKRRGKVLGETQGEVKIAIEQGAKEQLRGNLTGPPVPDHRDPSEMSSPNQTLFFAYLFLSRFIFITSLHPQGRFWGIPAGRESGGCDIR